MSIESINNKFKSGNDVPVSDVRVTREEWEAVNAEVDSLQNKLQLALLGEVHYMEKEQAVIVRLNRALGGDND